MQVRYKKDKQPSYFHNDVRSKEVAGPQKGNLENSEDIDLITFYSKKIPGVTVYDTADCTGYSYSYWWRPKTVDFTSEESKFKPYTMSGIDVAEKTTVTLYDEKDPDWSVTIKGPRRLCRFQEDFSGQNVDERVT